MTHELNIFPLFAGHINNSINMPFNYEMRNKTTFILSVNQWLISCMLIIIYYSMNLMEPHRAHDIVLTSMWRNHQCDVMCLLGQIHSTYFTSLLYLVHITIQILNNMRIFHKPVGEQCIIPWLNHSCSIRVVWSGFTIHAFQSKHFEKLLQQTYANYIY